MIFEIDNIELNFDGKNILRAVYLKTETGKITGILGRNGTGKSCLLKIIFGSLPSKYKLIRIDKKPLLKKAYLTGKIKYLPQTDFLPNKLKIKKAFEIFGVSWKNFLEDFGFFKKYEDSKTEILSGGEKRLLQAYLIIKSPCDLLLLDEPFSHIAPLYVNRIKAILKQEKKQKAIILTDHLFREILEISDEIYILKSGETKLLSKDKIQNHHDIFS